MYKLRNIQWITNDTMNDKWATVTFDDGVKITVCRQCAEHTRNAIHHCHSETLLESMWLECRNGCFNHLTATATPKQDDPACFNDAVNAVRKFFTTTGEDFSTVESGNVLTVIHNETYTVGGTMFYAENGTITYVNYTGVAVTFNDVAGLTAWLFQEGK